MNQNTIIKQLKMLKAVEPSNHALESMKRDVFYRIQTHEIHFRPAFLYGALILTVFLLVLIASITPFSSMVEKTYVTTQIILAQNNYQKATIAFAYTQEKLATLENSNNQLSSSQIEDISQATNFANAQLASLNLAGEEGKYTGNQCQQLYKKYYTYLEEVKNTTTSRGANASDNVSEKSIELFNTQLEEYKQQAKEKLSRY